MVQFFGLDKIIIFTIFKLVPILWVSQYVSLNRSHERNEICSLPLKATVGKFLEEFIGTFTNDVLVVKRVTCEKNFEVRLTTPFEVIQKFGLVCSCCFYLYCATKLDMDFKKP